MTTYEKRMTALQAQIKELEAENVAKKDWVLMGEATSKSRPQDSLLQEDLEFERTMKAVPVITEAFVQGLEERIKARIIEGRFDDVARIRPVDDKPFLPSRFFELQDTKSSHSLAQIYEGEYVAAQNGGTTGDDRDGRLKKEHAEITILWDSICSKLDALCNAHYTPKAVRAFIPSCESNTQNINSRKPAYRQSPMFPQLLWNRRFLPAKPHLLCLLQKRFSKQHLLILALVVSLHPRKSGHYVQRTERRGGKYGTLLTRALTSMPK